MSAIKFPVDNLLPIVASKFASLVLLLSISARISATVGGTVYPDDNNQSPFPFSALAVMPVAVSQPVVMAGRLLRVVTVPLSTITC